MRRALLSLGLLLAACGSDPATQILVEVDAADDVRARTAFVRLRVEAAAAGGELAPVTELGDVTIPVAAGDWPRVHVVAPLDGDASRIFRVTARALDDDFRTVAEARRQSGYVAGETRVLRVFIPGGECLEVTCPDDRTCEQGLCLEVPMIPPELLPRPGEGERDGGVDGGGDDGGVDGGVCDPTSIECEPAGECELAEVSCESGEPVCVRTPRAVDFVCRAAAGECDAEELCDGTSPFCPDDAPVAFGTECSMGFCFGEVCGTCTPGGDCDTGNPCEIGQVECGETGEPSCVPMRAADPGTVCRAATGPCDVAETCEGTTCPSDARAPAGETCRAATGLCDQAEVCDGTSALCPADGFRAAGTECRASGGGCDPAETCSGSGPSCPADVIAMAGVVCRSAADVCDVSEVCDGNARTCPADGFAAFGTSCGITASFICDGAGKCEETSCGQPCDTGRPCEEGTVECTPTGQVCVSKGPRAAGTVCRAANGACDVAETCSGSSIDCPPDSFAGNSTVCRPAAGPCDAPEACSGMGPNCPVDQLRPSTHVCRAAVSGGCDRPELCSGSGVTCPTDTFQSSGTICRASTGACDVPEVCSGTSATCPNDLLRPANTVCRAAAHPSCDRTEVCSGTERSCPSDEAADPGDFCSDRPSFYGGVCTDTSLPGGDLHRCLDLVISEVRLGLNGYVELYNRFCQPLPLRDCGLSIQGSFGSATFVPLERSIPAGGFYLIGLGLAGADLNGGAAIGSGLANQQSATFTLFCHETEIDRVVLVADESGAETAAFCRNTFGTIGNTALERKASASSTSETMAGTEALAGNAYDTDTSVDDFVCRTMPQPQGSSAPSELAGCQ